MRATVRQWLALPNDNPVGYFLASVGEGGLGSPSMHWLLPFHRQNHLLGLVPGRNETSITDPYLAKEVFQCNKWLTDGTTNIADEESCKKRWAAHLHGLIEGFALRLSLHRCAFACVCVYVPAKQSFRSTHTHAYAHRYRLNLKHSVQVANQHQWVMDGIALLRLPAYMSDCERLRGQGARARFSHWLGATTTNERSERVWSSARNRSYVPRASPAEIISTVTR